MVEEDAATAAASDWRQELKGWGEFLPLRGPTTTAEDQTQSRSSLNRSSSVSGSSSGSSADEGDRRAAQAGSGGEPQMAASSGGEGGSSGGGDGSSVGGGGSSGGVGEGAPAARLSLAAWPGPAAPSRDPAGSMQSSGSISGSASGFGSVSGSGSRSAEPVAVEAMILPAPSASSSIKVAGFLRTPVHHIGLCSNIINQPPAGVCLTDLAWDYPGV